MEHACFSPSCGDYIINNVVHANKVDEEITSIGKDVQNIDPTKVTDKKITDFLEKIDCISNRKDPHTYKYFIFSFKQRLTDLRKI